MNVAERTFKVLVVEDNPGDVRLIRDALETGSTVEVDVAMDGHAASEVVASGPVPDLVLMDINLPGFSGLDLLRQIRSSSQHRGVPVVMFTSSSMVEDVRAAETLGADMFLVKPFDVGEYMAAIRQVRDRFMGERRT